MERPEWVAFSERELWWDIPDTLKLGLERWVDHGIVPGSFLRAVLQNDFCEAVLQADYQNVQHLRSIARFVYEVLPYEAWGNRVKVIDWSRKGGLKGNTTHLWSQREKTDG